MSLKLPVPEGFEEMASRGQFTVNNGPFYMAKRTADGLARYAFLPEEKHCNSLNFVHGGMIATFLDSSMARTVADDFRFALLTVDLNVSYQNLVAKGRWVTSEASTRRIDEEFAAAEAVLYSRGAICAKATGKFKLMLNRPIKPRSQ